MNARASGDNTVDNGTAADVSGNVKWYQDFIRHDALDGLERLGVAWVIGQNRVLWRPPYPDEYRGIPRTRCYGLVGYLIRFAADFGEGRYLPEHLIALRTQIQECVDA